jgi:hypothetical protein
MAGYLLKHRDNFTFTSMLFENDHESISVLSKMGAIMPQESH